MKAKVNSKDLIGEDLKGFKIVEMTEVYKVDEDGIKSRSLGFFKDSIVAAAFTSAQVDANWHQTGVKLILTDGKVGFVVEQQESVILFDDEKEAVLLRKKVLAKLSSADRAILGVKE